MELEILFEDNHLLVVYKPRGVLSQAADSSKTDMLNVLKKYLVDKYNKSGDAYLGLVHRLDRNTSGVMVYAKTSKAAARLSLAIKKHEFEKKYYALVEGVPSAATLIDFVDKDEKNKKAYISSNGKEAKLSFTILKTMRIKETKCSLVDISLYTGRFHQIRVQFANIGHPLYGDKKYGSTFLYPYYLECYSLSFVHPIRKEKLAFVYNKEGTRI